MGKLKIYDHKGELQDFDPIDAAGSIPFTADQAMGSHKLTELGAPATAGDALRYNELGLANGIATLDASVLVPEAQIPHTLANALILNGGATLGADLDMNDFGLDNLHNINVKAGVNFLFFMGDDGHYISMSSGDGLFAGGNIALYGKTCAPVGAVRIRTPNAAWNAAIARLEMGGGADVVDAVWTAAEHTGFVYKPVAAPGAPREGEVYYDSGANKLKVWTGAAWEEITSA